MFGFVKTEEKQKLVDNNNLLIERKRKEKIFLVSFIILSVSVLNIVLYFLTRTN